MPELAPFYYPGCCTEREFPEVSWATDLAQHRKVCHFCHEYLKRIDDLIARQARKTDKEKPPRKERLW
jgi:hypothetical protein